MVTPRMTRVWRAYKILSFPKNFFQKIHHKVLYLEIQLILSIGPKLKKLLESIKNDTKATTMRVWNELRPKLLHQ